MRFLFLCLILLALSYNAVESEICHSKGALRRNEFSNSSVGCANDRCFAIQVCTINATVSFVWTNLCYDEDWYPNSMNVYCRQLGYSGAKTLVLSSLLTHIIVRSYKDYGSGMVKLSNIICTGDEMNILSCMYNTTTLACPYPLYRPDFQCTDCFQPNCSHCMNGGRCDNGSCACLLAYTGSCCETSIDLSDSTSSMALSGADTTTRSPTVPNVINITKPPLQSTAVVGNIISLNPTPLSSSLVISPRSIPSTDSVIIPTSIPSTDSDIIPTSTPSTDDVIIPITIPPINNIVESITSTPPIEVIYFPSPTSTDIPQATNTIPQNIPTSDKGLTKSISTSTATNIITSAVTPSQTITQESRLSSMLIPILVPIIAIFAILIFLSIAVLILVYVFCSWKRKTKHNPIDYYERPFWNELSEFGTTRQVEPHNDVIDARDNNAYYTSINESSLLEENAYAEIGKQMLASEYVPTIALSPINNYYQLVENEMYGDLVEGEVGDCSLYEQLPGMDLQAYYKLFAVVNVLENPLYDPIYIEPPTSLPQLENLFGQCFNEISREDIGMGEEFASGQFGVVYRAVYHTEKGDIPVAIKTLKEAANADTKVAFMREAAILAQFQHPNVLRMIGVLTTQLPYMMVTELLKTELADLLLKMKCSDPAHIQNLPPLLLRFSQEIAAGMNHLSEKHFIHRDLAARNVLVAKDLSCRIADFGMSRELHSDSEYYTSSGGRIPLRWTAPEAVFYQKYSEKSDVWSFGMTLYEIWSLCEKPWGANTSNDDIIEGMCAGKKLSPPTGCPRDVYRVMVETWRADASVRPPFSEALLMLTRIQLPPPLPLSVDHPSRCLGNDPFLSQDLYLDLQQIQ